MQRGFYRSPLGALLVGGLLFGLTIAPFAYYFATYEGWSWDAVVYTLVVENVDVDCPACERTNTYWVEVGKPRCSDLDCQTPLPDGRHYHAPGQLLHGLWMTVKISLFALVLGLPLGLFGGLARLSKNAGARLYGTCYVELIRNTPLLVQIYISYYVLGSILDVFMPEAFDSVWFAHRPFLLGGFALAVFSGAYITEIVRAGILSIDVGQSEAARALGMSPLQTMRHIILPQALKRILPPLTGQCISLIKDSSLCSVISVVEMVKSGRNIYAANFRTFETWFTVAFLYFLICLPISLVVRRMELQRATD